MCILHTVKCAKKLILLCFVEFLANPNAMAISSKQIRAARGLLHISQKELAEKAHLSINSLNNIEREVGSPRLDSMKSIEDALASLGIEFLDKDGVRLAGEELKIKRIEGADLITRFYDEILRAYPTGN